MPEFFLSFRTPEARDRYAALSQLAQGYVEAMYFTSTGPDDDDLAEAAFDDLASEAMESIVSDCDAFAAQAEPMITFPSELLDDHRMGRDFWYSRSGAGTGFWARDELGDAAERLDRIATGFTTTDLYRGDDGLIYLS